MPATQSLEHKENTREEWLSFNGGGEVAGNRYRVMKAITEGRIRTRQFAGRVWVRREDVERLAQEYRSRERKRESAA